MEQALNKRQLQHQKTLKTIRLSIDDLMEEKGFEAVTIREICERSGITVGTFYHYFHSKNDILEDRYRRCADYFFELYETRLIDMEAPEAIKVFTEEFLKYSKTRIVPIFKRFYQVMLDECENWRRNHANSNEDIVRKLVERGQLEKTIRQDLSAEVITDMIMVLLNGMNINALLYKEELYESSEMLKLFDELLERIIDK